MQELNKELLIYLNSLLDNPIIEKITLIFSDLPIFFLPIFLGIAWLYYTYKEKNINKKKDLLFIFYSCLIWIIINLVIKNIVHIDRPETVIEWVWKLLLDHIPDASFPSDHATVSTAFLISLFYWDYKKTGLIFMIAMIIMNLSRIILWVHWPLDVICWMFVWILSATISFKIIKNKWFLDSLNDFLIKIFSYIKL